VKSLGSKIVVRIGHVLDQDLTLAHVHFSGTEIIRAMTGMTTGREVDLDIAKSSASNARVGVISKGSVLLDRRIGKLDTLQATKVMATA
jgi:hypothetical protein